jgi:hypothetical protein
MTSLSGIIGEGIPSVNRRAAKMPLVLTMVVVGLFIPQELSFYLFGLRLTVVRLIFLLLAPVLIAKAAAKLSAGRLRILPSDLLVIMSGFWLIYAPANLDSLALALNHAGPVALEFCVGYLSTRILMSERGQALHFADVLCRAIAVVALLGALDPLTNHFFVRDLAGQIGEPNAHLSDWLANPDAYRLGLMRAMGPIEHPILFGFVCSVGVIIAVALPVRARAFCVLSCSLGAVLAFSSAPIQGMLMGFGLLAYNRLFCKVRRRWLFFFIVSALGVAVIFVMSGNAVGFIISNLTFSPQSGFYREWTWETVTAYVSQSPWFGLGLGPLPDEINHSIDSLWLVLAIEAGYPGAVLVALSLMGANPMFGSRTQTPDESILATTLGILLFLTIFIAFTVHLWGCTWILAGLLLGAKAHLTELGYINGRAARRSLASATAFSRRSARQYRLPI